MAPSTSPAAQRNAKSFLLRALPSIISLSRVVLAAAFVVARDPDVRFGLVAAAAITDFLDGWIARRARVTSRWGALIDPIADRVFALVAVSTFLFTGELSTLGYFVMISRDIMTAIGFLVARAVSWLRPIEFRARLSGKVVTVLQMLVFAALLRMPTWVTPLLWLVGAASLYSIADYTLALWRERAR
jgi:phosphatidylglycerophosphate synthase